MQIKYVKYDMRSMVYVKYSPEEYFTDFINIDWSSFENKNEDDYITIGYDDRVIVGDARNYGFHYITRINHGKAILFHNEYRGNFTQHHIYLSASMMQFDHELYYIPFDHYYKIMEIALYNADMLPKERLRQLYHEQIKMKYQAMKNEDISLDILDSQDEIKNFWCQDTKNLSKIKFGKFYISYFLHKISINIFRESNYYRSGLADWRYKHDIDARLILFNHFPDTPILTREEFNALEYVIGYTQNYPYYRLFKRTKNNDNNNIDFEALEKADDTIFERRIKNRHINGIEQSAYYYDIDNTNQLFKFHIDEYGNIDVLNHPYLDDKHISLIDFVRLT